MSVDHERISELLGSTAVDLRAENAELRAEVHRLRLELDRVADLIESVLYDPSWRTDAEKKDMPCDDLYLMAGPVQESHLPALRRWFVEFCENRC